MICPTPNQLDQDLAAYAYRRFRARRNREAANQRAKKAASPVTCHNCRRTKTAARQNPPTCGACYSYEYRYGRPRPVVNGGAS